MTRKVAIIGAGAAGMFAAAVAAAGGCEVHLFEKNDRLGKKLYITGKGRCNLTNACDMEELFDAVMTNSKFLYSAFYGFTNRDAMDFFEKEGMPLKIERGNRVFPASDHSGDVIDALRRSMKKNGVHIHLCAEVTKVLASGGRVTGIEIRGEETPFLADAVLIATGGLSYQSTGSTGDGYRFAEDLGHEVTKLVPSLVPFNVREDVARELQGLSLKNVELTLLDGKKKLYCGFGEMMFTHFGITGPLVLTASSHAARVAIKKELSALVDLKPALTVEQLDRRILRDFGNEKNRRFKNALGGLFPAKLIPVMIKLSGISPEKQVNEISRDERQKFTLLIKKFPLTVTGLRGYNEAVVTKGGVNVREIQPSTMESKLVRGLYFAGEVLDLDAVTGGFNLQIAWSTAYAAAMALSGREEI